MIKNKIQRTLILAMTMGTIAMVATACGSNDKYETMSTDPAANSSEVTEETSSMAETQTMAEDTTQADTETTTDSALVQTMQTAPINGGEVNGCGAIIGTVKTVADDMSSVVMTGVDGADYTIDMTAIDSELRNELVPDLSVAVFYEGHKEGSDVSGITKYILMLDGQEDNFTINVMGGTTTSNMMSSFAMTGDNGTDYNFLKDNCYIADGALQADSGEKVSVTFVVQTDGTSWPLKVELGE